MGELWLVRHGETEWSRSGQHTGRTDIELTAEGEEQARALAARLERPWALVLTSPLKRALRTVEIAGLSAKPDPDLMEWDYGHAEGRTTAELSEERGGWRVWTDDTLGETVQQLGERCARVLDKVSPALQQGDVLIVAHGHFLRVLAAVWLGLPPADGRLFALSPATVSVLGHEREVPVMIRWNT
jgi:broad specificity phosphatase PhoE